MSEQTEMMSNTFSSKIIPPEDWVEFSVGAVPTCDETGAQLTGRPKLISEAMQKLMRVISEWQVEMNATHLLWTYAPKYYRNEEHTAIIVVVEVHHEGEVHEFKAEANWGTDTTAAEKMEYCNCPPPQRISTGA